MNEDRLERSLTLRLRGVVRPTVAFAVNQPDDVDVNKMLFRSTRGTCDGAGRAEQRKGEGAHGDHESWFAAFG